MHNVMGLWQYMTYVEEVIVENKADKSYGRRVTYPARRFLLQPSGATAIPFRGYTIITPPRDEDDAHAGNGPAYNTLDAARAGLASVDGLVMAPPKEWHMTLAGLVAEREYAALEASKRTGHLVGGVHALFCDMQQFGAFPVCNMDIRGVALLPTCVIAVLAPTTQQDYQTLLSFRHFIYAESATHTQARFYRWLRPTAIPQTAPAIPRGCPGQSRGRRWP